LSRYVGPSCKLCRREGIKLFLKGERCYTEKCAIEKRNYPPGQHVDTKGKVMEYAMRLREKQRARRIYGLSEKQFRRFFTMAERKEGITGTNFLILLERRIDNMVFRLGFCDVTRGSTPAGFAQTHCRQWQNRQFFSLHCQSGRCDRGQA